MQTNFFQRPLAAVATSSLLLCSAGALAELVEYDFNFSGGTGALVYDTVSGEANPITLDFGVFGSLTTDFGQSLTASVFGNPPNSFVANDNTFFPLRINGVNTYEARLWSDGRYCIRDDGSGCLFDGSDLATGTYEIGVASTAASLTCSGFLSPLADGPVTVRKNRVLPFKARLQDENLQYKDDASLADPPVIQVVFDAGTMEAVDVTDEALSAGKGTDGNQFEFTNDAWQFNLKTKGYTASGTYEVTIQSGDESEYVINPQCTGQFVIK